MRFYFQKKGRIHFSLSSTSQKQRFKKKKSRNFTFICKSQAMLLHTAKIVSIQMSLSLLNLIHQYPQEKRQNFVLLKRWALFSKLIMLLKASAFVMMLIALTNVFYTICADSARSLLAVCRQVNTSRQACYCSWWHLQLSNPNPKGPSCSSHSLYIHTWRVFLPVTVKISILNNCKSYVTQNIQMFSF